MRCSLPGMPGKGAPGTAISLLCSPRDGWTRVRQDFAADPAVMRAPGRRDWIELHLKHESDLDRLTGLLAIATAANA